MGGILRSMGNLKDLEAASHVPHIMQPDGVKQEHFVSMLREKEFNTASIVRWPKTSYGVHYSHYGVILDTVPPYLIQFGGGNFHNATVEITITIDDGWECVYEKELEESERENLLNRAFKVVGSTRYSILLRNCEHVANYIVKNHWFSSQIEDNENFKIIYTKFVATVKDKINVTPNDIIVNADFIQITETSLLDFNEIFEVKQKLSDTTNNILLLGPTGSGKSNLVNFLLGKRLVSTDLSPDSVTTHTSFIKCTKSFNTVYLIDTLGLTDSRWDPVLIHKMITSRLLSKTIYIHQVWIVLRFESRLTSIDKKALHQALNWVQKTKKVENFKVILTHCPDDLVDGKKDCVLNEFKLILKDMMLPDNQFATVNFKDPTIFSQKTNNLSTQMQIIEQWLNESPEPLDEFDSPCCNIL